MYNRPRGTIDIYGLDLQKISYIEKCLISACRLYGFEEIRTPIFEHIEVFTRSVGETSDIVKKEFYNFKDKGDREIALRPEGTASVIRAIVEDKLLYKSILPLRFYYSGPMFRYERPQSGRLRQFNQIGCELIGSNSIYDDALILLLALDGINNIGIKKYKVVINNLGSFASRKKWIAALITYFSKYQKQLSPLSIERLKSKNPLRIFDDKIDSKKTFVKNAPKLDTFLTPNEKSDFALLCNLLKSRNVKFIVDATLVRGLDYYTNFIFEIVSTSSKLTGQSTICGGGRYAKLISEFGDKDTSCVGFAWGVSRLVCALNDEINIKYNVHNSLCCVFGICDKTSNYIYNIVNTLIDSSVHAIAYFEPLKINKGLVMCEKLNVKNAIIIGENELKNKTVTIKNLDTREQNTVSLNMLINFLTK